MFLSISKTTEEMGALAAQKVKELIDKAVGYVKYTGKMNARGHVVVTRAAGHKKDHGYLFIK